jgi:hypothetical protein
MFANWYAELNLFSLATFPPVSAEAKKGRKQGVCGIFFPDTDA